MRILAKSTAALLVCGLTLTAAAAGTAPAKQSTHTIRPLLPPVVAITSATNVTDTSARLNGTVISLGTTNYRFDYGTTGFTNSTSTTAGLIGSLAVNKTVAGLQPGTTYMWRLVAGGSTVSSTGYFTTGAAGAAGSGGSTVLGVIDTSHPEPHSGGAQGVGAVVLNPGKAIEILIPGATEFVSLGQAASVPDGTTIRAEKDEVAITSVDESGKQQTGYFWGGTFKVNQLGGGLVELKLVSDFSACGTKGKKRKTRAATASAAKAKKGKSGKAKGTLWGRDSGGKFRTKGRSSVATVRGTRWYTEDRCNGTLTKVAEGKVSVKPKKGKAKLVTAGKSFFAKR